MEGLLEYVRTGEYREQERKLAQLEKECPAVEADEEQDSAAGRWGIPSASRFNLECRYMERDRIARCKDPEGNPVEGDGEVLYVSTFVRDLLGKLGSHARSGSPFALEAVCFIARWAAQCTDRLTRERPKEVRAITEKLDTFPILVSRHTDMSGRKYIKGKLDLLNIGEHSVVNHSGYDIRSSTTPIELPDDHPVNHSGFDIRSPEKGHLFNDAIDEMCRRLLQVFRDIYSNRRLLVWDQCPEWVLEANRAFGLLSSRTSLEDAKKSFRAAWGVLCEATDGHPEELPLLKPIGMYKKDSVKAASSRKSKFRNGLQRGLHDRLQAGWLARFARQKLTTD